MLTLDLFQTTALAVIALWLGDVIKRRVHAFEHFCIPSPVIGGILFALLSLFVYLTGLFILQFDDTMKQICMVFFFTSVGFQAKLSTIRQGGRPLVILIALVAILIVVQNTAAVATARCLSLTALTGMTAGSIPMLGGHGTAGAFGPMLEQFGVSGATTLATAAATFGLVAGSLIGGPIAERLIERRDLLSAPTTDDDWTDLPQDARTQRSTAAAAVFQIVIAAGIGTLVSHLLSLTGLTFPIYIGGMLVGATMRNIAEYTHLYHVPMHRIDSMGSICLSLFLGIAMMTLRLWELASLALPLVLMLSLQLLIMILFARYIVFPLMGRDYDAAVMTAGFCGFGMGATPNAMANMQAICDKYRPSLKAYLLIPIIGSMFADFINSIVITLFINFL